MNELTSLKCVSCRRDEPMLTNEQIAQLKPYFSLWNLIEVEGVQRLERSFRFKNFATALAFTNKIGALAEEEGHHPALLTEWGKVTVTWWTHAIHGLHRNDCIMAAKTDQIYTPSA